MLDVVLTIPFWFELAATITGGLSGAMSAVRARYDIFGVMCIAIVTGLAGGILRDVLLQNFGIYAFQKPSLLIACAAIGVVVFYLGKLTTYLDPVLDLLDNLSVGMWAVISVGKASSAGMDVVPSIILGTLAAVGGGIVRDICMNREPGAFQSGTLYGSAALIGCAAYAVMHQYHILDHYAEFICIALIIGIRYLSLFFGWRTREPKDYSDKVTRAVARPIRSIAHRVHPPKGKIARERERTAAYEQLRRFWRVPGATSPLPPREYASETPTGTLRGMTEKMRAAAYTSDTDPDSSDRIMIENRDELRSFIEQAHAQTEDDRACANCTNENEPRKGSQSDLRGLDVSTSE